MWFYDPQRDNEGVFNKMVSYVDGPFCHCELQFHDDTAFTVYMGQNISMRQRKFDPEFYTEVCLKPPLYKVTQARQRATSEYESKKMFSFFNMSSCVFGRPLTTNGTFCSKLIVTILKNADILNSNIDENTTSPSALYRILNSTVVEENTCSIPIDFKVKHQATPDLSCLCNIPLYKRPEDIPARLHVTD